MPGKQRYAGVGQRGRLEKLRTRAVRVGEVGISDQVAGTGKLDQHRVTAGARAVNLDQTGQHGEDDVGGRAHRKQLGALGITHEHVALEERRRRSARKPHR